MSKIDFEGEYGSAGSREVYFARIRRGLGLEKASFGGDRSAAGRYAAQQRWKGHVKDATKPAVRERRMAEKFQEGPILKNGHDNFGFPKLLTPDEAKERFGENLTMQKAYFAGRGLDVSVGAKSDGSLMIDTESPEYFATLQALDDVLDQVDLGKLTADPKNGLLPQVFINDMYPGEATVGGYFAPYGNDVAVFMNPAKLIERRYAENNPLNPVTVPQLTVDAIQDGMFGGDSIAARMAYGFTVHEMGHWIDNSLARTQKLYDSYWSEHVQSKAYWNAPGTSEAEKLFGQFDVGHMATVSTGMVRSPMGTQYSNTAPVERFAENFTAWFTLTKVDGWRINNLKRDLSSQGGFVAVGAALEVLKQDQIVDNLLNWPPNHPVFLFAFRGEPFDVDAFKQQLLVGMIKASFAGDRSAAGRYAANMRWQGQRKVAGFVGTGVYKLGADGSIHPKALVEEMTAEHPDGDSGYHLSTEPKKWKALVCKNLATNMTDVSTKDILNVVDGFALDSEGKLDVRASYYSGSLREVLDGKVKTFILAKDGSILDASKEDFVENQLSKLNTGQEREHFANLNGRYWDEKAVDGEVFNADTPEGQIALKQAAVKPLVDAWAATANDARELSLAVQDTAQKIFKVDALSWNSNTTDKGDFNGGMAVYSTKETYKPSSTITAERTKVLSSFLLAQYAATQQYFDAKGIKEVTLFRGMKGKPTDPDRNWTEEFQHPDLPPEEAEILMRPLSSWATRLEDANYFAKPSYGKPYGTLVKARIKTKDILAIPFTGIGCLDEAEVVVIGRPVQGSSRASYEPIGGFNAQEKRSYKSEVQEWAYADETGEAP